jgi:hypothetical protein
MIIFNPSSSRRVAISLYNNENFYLKNFDYIPFLNVYRKTIPSNTVKKFTPSLDFFNSDLQVALKLAAVTLENYNFGLIKSLKINDIKFFEPVETYTWSKFITSPQNNVLKTEGNLSLSVILPYDAESPNSKFLQQIWRLGVYWFVPFFLSTDVYPQNIGGPLFVKKFSISASDSVSIDLSFVGGTAYNLENNFYQNKNWIDFKNYYSLDEIATTGVGFTAPELGINSTYSEFRSVFRVAKNYDCLIIIESFSFKKSSNSNIPAEFIGVSTFYEQYSSPAQTIVFQGNNIYNMTLDIDNDLELKYTANDGVTKNILNGARYISLKKRSVTGTIEFIASQNLQNCFGVGVNKSLVLYFGGPFYFPMKNVTFQVFSLDVSADADSYIHKVGFTALLQESIYSEYYNQNEFDIHLNGLFGPPRGEIYVQSQDTATNNNTRS